MEITLENLKAVQQAWGYVTWRNLALHLSPSLAGLSADEQSVCYRALVLEAKATLKRYAKSGVVVVARPAEFLPGQGMQPTKYRLA